MLDVKKLLAKIISNQPRRITHTFTVPALSAGAKGYWTISLGETLPTGAAVMNVWHASGSVAGLTGLQITPINASGSNLYVEYYAPTAITGDTYNITFHVWYVIT